MVVLEAWQSVTQAQATIVAGLLTMIAAIGAVLIGSWLFSGRVKDMKGAVDETEKIVRAHRDEVNLTLAELREGLGQLRGTVSDIQSAAPTDAQNENEWAAWETLRNAWTEIRDELERIAADPQIDGRTRARYGRIDRRQYWRLIDALTEDRRLGSLGADFAAANTLWQRFKSGRRVPDKAAVEQMEELRQRIAPRAGAAWAGGGAATDPTDEAPHHHRDVARLHRFWERGQLRAQSCWNSGSGGATYGL